ncbi:hypothetical protein Tco_1507258 [Tanacetum coccineum]
MFASVSLSWGNLAVLHYTFYKPMNSPTFLLTFYAMFSQEINIVMSDSEDSTVTYTAVSSPFGGLSDIGSPGVDGPPVMPEDPYAYVVAAFQAPPSPDYMPSTEEPE